MQDIIGVKFIKKSNPTIQLIVENYNENYVQFTNGARCKLQTLKTDFMTDDLINVEEFFNDDKRFNNLQKEIKVGNVNTREEPGGVIMTTTMTNPQQQQYTPPQTYTPPPTYTNPDINDVPVAQPINVQQVYTQQPEQSNYIQPEYALFRKMKRTQLTKLNIVIEEALPKREQLNVMNDMFEISASRVFAEEFVDKLFYDREILIAKIAQQIENYIYNQNENEKEFNHKQRTPRKNKNNTETTSGNNEQNVQQDS